MVRILKSSNAVAVAGQPLRADVLALITAAVLGSVAMPAQSAEPISTDRPDFVESSLVVDAWTLQIETSVAL